MKVSTLYRLPLLTFLAVILTTFASAQTPTPKPTVSDEDQIVKVNSRLVVVPVSVTDANGQAVPGLTVKDFRVSEENRPQTLDAVRTADEVPLEIALLFDVSASTDAMFKFEQQTAAKFLRDVMRPIDRATVFTIGASPVLVSPRDNADRSIAAINAIAPTKAFTAFYDSVSVAAEYLRKNAPEGTRRVVVVISDGEDTNSTGIAKAIQNSYTRVGKKIDTIDSKELYQLTVTTRNEASAKERARVLKGLQDADTVFYSINPAGSSFQLNQMSVFGQENMQQFASQTGGTAFLPKFAPIDTKNDLQDSANIKKNSEMLDRIFTQLANELRAQYLVQYYSEGEFPNNRYVKLDVAVDRPGTKVRARQGYYVKN